MRWICPGGGGWWESPGHHGQKPSPGEPDGQQEVYLPALLRGRQHGGWPPQHIRHVLHDPEADRGRLLRLLRQIPTQTLGHRHQQCVQVTGDIQAAGIHILHSKQNLCPDYGSGQEKLWKKLVECQAYNDRVVELLSRLGNHVKIIFRLSCVQTLQENRASRLNDYFRLFNIELNKEYWLADSRDEMTSERDIESSYYLYERSGLLYGQFYDGNWQFGVKLQLNNSLRFEVLASRFSFRIFLHAMESSFVWKVRNIKKNCPIINMFIRPG